MTAISFRPLPDPSSPFWSSVHESWRHWQSLDRLRHPTMPVGSWLEGFSEGLAYQGSWELEASTLVQFELFEFLDGDSEHPDIRLTCRIQVVVETDTSESGIDSFVEYPTQYNQLAFDYVSLGLHLDVGVLEVPYDPDHPEWVKFRELTDHLYQNSQVIARHSQSILSMVEF